MKRYSSTTHEAAISTKEYNSDMGLVDIVVLIRSVQRAEGNFDCFGRSEGRCDRQDCEWRRFCLKINHKSGWKG
jgi:hypothetical protein